MSVAGTPVVVGYAVSFCWKIGGGIVSKLKLKLFLIFFLFFCSSFLRVWGWAAD